MMVIRKATLTIAVYHLIHDWHIAQAFFIPIDSSSKTFSDDDLVELYVDRLTSTELPFPIDYNSLPLCKTDQTSTHTAKIGNFLISDHTSPSLYDIHMKREMYCEQLCISDLGSKPLFSETTDDLVRIIQKNYHHNWIIDNLPAAYKESNQLSNSTKYYGGFPIGFIGPNDGLPYIYNHVNIELQYHVIDDEPDNRKFRIVGFTIQPFSIRHDFERNIKVADVNSTDSSFLSNSSSSSHSNSSDFFSSDNDPFIASINDPIPSCNPDLEKTHTNAKMVSESSAQILSGSVLFTYDVIWSNNEDVQWTSRWNIYLNMNGTHNEKFHWLFIASSLAPVLIFSGIIAAVLVPILKNNCSCYSSVPTEEETSDNLIAWKAISADVFRPPSQPMLFSVCCGCGVQILLTSIFAVTFIQTGLLPCRYYFLFILLLYALMGFSSGYTTARVFKSFKGKGWKKATTLTAVGYSGFIFSLFIVYNILAMVNYSIYLPAIVVLQLAALWFGVSTPIVFWGAFVGFKQARIKFPSYVNSIPREIPRRPRFMGQISTIIFGGFLPFFACFYELHCVMPSLWSQKYYNIFGFSLLAFLMLLLTSAIVAMLFIYYQFRQEDYRWWWQSFIVVGSTGIYVFGYSFLFYFQEYRGESISSFVVYFGSMALTSITITLMVGCVGFLSSLWFNWIIFTFVEQEMCDHETHDSSGDESIRMIT